MPGLTILNIILSKSIIAALFAAQIACFASGITRPVPHRLDQLRRLRRAILAHEQDIEAALQSDLGKCRTEAYMCEIGMVLSELGYLLRRTRRYCRATHVLTPLAKFFVRRAASSATTRRASCSSCPRGITHSC